MAEEFDGTVFHFGSEVKYEFKHSSEDERAGRKRYLAVSSGSRFLKDIRVRDREDVASFRLVLPPRKGARLTEAEEDAITAIVFHAASVFHSCDLDFDGMQLEIVNDPFGDDVLWSRDPRHRDRYHLSMCADTFEDWSQTIYQLGYGFAHCIMDYRYASGRVPWMEETVCEAMPLWLLGCFAISWKEFRLSGLDPDYDDHLMDYLSDFMTDQAWTNRPARCASMKELLAMNENAAGGSDDRIGAVIVLYQLIHPDDLAPLFSCGLYADDIPGMADTDSWLARCPGSLAVRYLASLQDNAVRDDPAYRALREAKKEKLSEM